MRRLSASIGLASGLAVLSACAARDSGVSAIVPMPSTVSVRATLASLGQRERDARAPSGYIDYCRRNPEDCAARPGEPDRIAYSGELWAMLNKVNAVVNATIQPEEDKAHYGVADYWTVPVDGAGDCEDYVLAKRKMLVLLGLPQSTLRITVVLDRGIVRHAVLTVVTDRGDFVLDSLKDEILATDKTAYVWVERQDRSSRTGWVALR
jgi:predicted transglutaminase-like cysteine proteinase